MGKVPQGLVTGPLLLSVHAVSELCFWHMPWIGCFLVALMVMIPCIGNADKSLTKTQKTLNWGFLKSTKLPRENNSHLIWKQEKAKHSICPAAALWLSSSTRLSPEVCIMNETCQIHIWIIPNSPKCVWFDYQIIKNYIIREQKPLELPNMSSLIVSSFSCCLLLSWPLCC